MDVSHLHLHVRDRARAEAFYRRWFGLVTRRTGDEITFMSGDRDFLLALMQDSAPAATTLWMAACWPASVCNKRDFGDNHFGAILRGAHWRPVR